MAAVNCASNPAMETTMHLITEISSSLSSSPPPPPPPTTTTNTIIQAMIKAIVKDNKQNLLTTSTTLHSTVLPRETASHLLHIAFEFDSVNCAASLLNGEVTGVPIPVINEIDPTIRYAPIHTAAENHSLRCIELVVRKRGRIDIKTRKPKDDTTTLACRGLHRMLPLELSLRCVRLDIKWGPTESLDNLLLILSQKDLRAISLLSEKTEETGEVAYAIAMEGQVAALAALLMVAADKVNGSVLEIRNRAKLSAEKTTLYSCVIKEAISIFNPNLDKHKGVEEIDDNAYHGVGAKERRVLLLREIELLYFFGASHTNSGLKDKKVVSPLILACRAGDEEVIQLLLKTDIDVNECDAGGNCALHWCLKASKLSNPAQIRILLVLLKHGARVRQKDKWGLTSVHIAARDGNLEALEILLSRDPATIHYTSELKETPLFLAVKNDLIECAQLLLHFGAGTEIHNLRRERPIELAKSQQMRSALNRTSVVITNRDSRQRITVQNDEVVSTQEILLKESSSSSESVNSSSDGDICKYFTAATGCARGSNCFFKHGEEDPVNKKSRSKFARFSALQEFKKKIFVGGIPPSIDSESLASIIQEKFGPVVDAKVLEMDFEGQIQSRGFGFVTFKDEKSVSAALDARYTNILGKKVEMKTAISKCSSSPTDSSDDESPREEPEKETVIEKLPKKTSQLQCQELSQIDISSSDTKHEKVSWASRVTKAQPEEPVNELKVRKRASAVQDMPKWFTVFRKWLPNFLWKMSKNTQKGEYYSLSSVKTDFKALYGLNLDHASLGYPKLSDFIRAYPELCSVKNIHTGGSSANHMILFPPKAFRPSPLTVSKSNVPAIQPKTPVHQSDRLIVSKNDFPELRLKTPVHESGDHKFLVGPLSSNDKVVDLSKIESDKDTVSSICSETSPKAAVSSSVVGGRVASVKPSSTDTVHVNNSRFLQFLAPDPIFLARTWRGTGGFKAPDEHFRPKHLVLEHLARLRKEVFFIRSIKFYDDYAASLKQGACFGCGKNRLVWANYPCKHLLWCSDCRFIAVRIAEVGTPSHKCVVCDHVVQKIDLIPLAKLQLQNYNDMEFPPIHAACLRSQKFQA